MLHLRQCIMNESGDHLRTKALRSSRSADGGANRQNAVTAMAMSSMLTQKESQK